MWWMAPCTLSWRGINRQSAGSRGQAERLKSYGLTLFACRTPERLVELPGGEREVGGVEKVGYLAASPHSIGYPHRVVTVNIRRGH